jgi:hypothetical protein
MLDGFMQRASETEQLLRSDVCGFLLIAGPDPLQARQAAAFSERLKSEGIRLLGLVANRVRTWPGAEPAPELSPREQARAAERLAKGLAELDPPFDPEAVAGVLIATAVRQARLAHQDRETLQALEEELRIDPAQVRSIPLLPEDVHELETLVWMTGAVFGSEDHAE